MEAFPGYTLYLLAIGWSLVQAFSGYTLYLLAIGWSLVQKNLALHCIYLQ